MLEKIDNRITYKATTLESTPVDTISINFTFKKFKHDWLDRHTNSTN